MVTCTQVLAHTDIHIHNLKKNSKSPPSQNYPLQTLWWVCQVPWPSREDSGLRWPKMWGVGLQRASPCTPLKLQSLGQLLLSQLLSGVTCGSHLRNAYSQLLVEDIFMGTKSNFAVLFPTIFSCHFGLHFPLFLTE